MLVYSTYYFTVLSSQDGNTVLYPLSMLSGIRSLAAAMHLEIHRVYV